MVPTKFLEEKVYQAVLDGELQIDSKGRIWRQISRGGNRWTPGKTISRIHKTRRAENASGPYMFVRVMWDNIRYQALAHRLVWLHFNGPIPQGFTVNHKNGRKQDNRPENLELATHSQQVIHALRILGVGRIDQSGEKNAMAKLTAEQVAIIRKRRASGEKLVSIATDFGVTFQTISKIARGNRWSGLLK